MGEHDENQQNNRKSKPSNGTLDSLENGTEIKLNTTSASEIISENPNEIQNTEIDPCLDAKKPLKSGSSYRRYLENYASDIQQWTGLSRRGFFYVTFLVIFAFLLSITVISLVVSWPRVPHKFQYSVCRDPACLRASAQITETLNPSVSPCHDLWGAFCSGWIQNATTQTTVSVWNQKQQVIKKDLEKVRNLISTLPLPLHTGTVEWKLRHLYEACMDVDTLNQEEARPLTRVISELVLLLVASAIAKPDIGYNYRHPQDQQPQSQHNLNLPQQPNDRQQFQTGYNYRVPQDQQPQSQVNLNLPQQQNNVRQQVQVGYNYQVAQNQQPQSQHNLNIPQKPNDGQQFQTGYNYRVPQNQQPQSQLILNLPQQQNNYQVAQNQEPQSQHNLNIPQQPNDGQQFQTGYNYRVPQNQQPQSQLILNLPQQLNDVRQQVQFGNNYQITQNQPPQSQHNLNLSQQQNDVRQHFQTGYNYRVPQDQHSQPQVNLNLLPPQNDVGQQFQIQPIPQIAQFYPTHNLQGSQLPPEYLIQTQYFDPQFSLPQQNQPQKVQAFPQPQPLPQPQNYLPPYSQPQPSVSEQKLTQNNQHLSHPQSQNQQVSQYLPPLQNGPSPQFSPSSAQPSLNIQPQNALLEESLKIQEDFRSASEGLAQILGKDLPQTQFQIGHVPQHLPSREYLTSQQSISPQNRPQVNIQNEAQSFSQGPPQSSSSHLHQNLPHIPSNLQHNFSVQNVDNSNLQVPSGTAQQPLPPANIQVPSVQQPFSHTVQESGKVQPPSDVQGHTSSSVALPNNVLSEQEFNSAINTLNSLQSKAAVLPGVSKNQEHVVKHIYLHGLPEDDVAPSVQLPKKKSYNIVFIKAPNPNNQRQVVQRTEEKTLVYVLVNKPEEPQITVKEAEKVSNKPEVYFIKYKAPNHDKKVASGSGVDSSALQIQSEGESEMVKVGGYLPPLVNKK